jgi:hypothetical protein
MFISSIDVEERRGYENRTKESKQKQKHAAYNEEEGQPSTEAWMDPESFYADADDANMMAPNHGSNVGDALSYEAAACAWSTYPKITAPEQLSEVGRVVGWWVSISPLRC